jgi:hypothetical protein
MSIRNQNLRHRIQISVSLWIGLCTLFFLASCGGGSGNETSTSATATEDGTKKSLGVSGSNPTVPIGWTGRPPKYEIINGITVPPEPAPSINNATLAGVDLNSNRVRDDVERKIAARISNPSRYSAALNYASSLQKMLTEPLPINRSEAIQRSKQRLCAGNPEDITAIMREMLDTDIRLQALTSNTPDRLNKFLQIDKIMGAYDGEELLCD